jgi:hypothetical protein
MKQFHFSLEKALAWRRMQARMERARWEQIRAEMVGLETARQRLSEEKQESAEKVLSQKSATGDELAALETFGQYVVSQQARLEIKRAECEKRMAEQGKLALAREREVKVLEHLRARRLETWTKDLEREIEQQAAEAYLARWRPASRADACRDK